MKEKMIAPIIIGGIVVLYYVFFFVFLLHAGIGFLGLMTLGIVPLLLAGAMVYVVWSRIKEIIGGEEDDLSKY